MRGDPIELARCPTRERLICECRWRRVTSLVRWQPRDIFGQVVGGKEQVGKEGFVELAPVFDKTALEKLGPRSDARLELVRALVLEVIGAMAIAGLGAVGVISVTVQGF